MTYTKDQKGFTLVELLVVIAIIGVLAGAVLLVLNPAQILRNGRNAKRLEEVDAVNKAVALALANNDITITTAQTGNSGADTLVVTGGGWVKFDSGTLAGYLSTLPLDPSPGDPYYYGTDTSGNYEINAILETDGSGTDDPSLRMQNDGGDEADVYEVGTALTILSTTTAP